ARSRSTEPAAFGGSVRGVRDRRIGGLHGVGAEASALVELSIRAYGGGCGTDRVALVEGWYVHPAWRRTGVGAELIRAAEAWARSQGCTEIASDTEADNVSSAAAHRALGFEETAVVRCFRKPL